VKVKYIYSQFRLHQSSFTVSIKT